MKKRSKNYTEVLNKLEKEKLYNKDEAIELIKKTNLSKFDATIDIAIRLNLDTKKADQQLRGAIVLPHGTGKTKKVLVLAKGSKATEAKEAEADFVGDDNLIEKIEKEKWIDFDVIIATPDMMPPLGKIGKILGPKGLMPNPKTGTITNDVSKAVKEIKQGKVEYRTDSLGIVHSVLGKCSFDKQQLLDNLEVLVDTIVKLKPKTVKGIYIKSIFISTTMGPSIKIDTKSFDNYII